MRLRRPKTLMQEIDEPVEVTIDYSVGDANTLTSRRPNGTLLTLGRAILGGYFLYNGINHFRRLDNMTAYAESQGVPMARAAVMVSGGLLLGGGASLLTGYKPKIGSMLIETFLLGVSPVMHRFWTAEGQARQMEQVNFLKNMALAGAALISASIPEPWPVSLSRKEPALV